jgi:hypothetical protein
MRAAIVAGNNPVASLYEQQLPSPRLEHASSACRQVLEAPRIDPVSHGISFKKVFAYINMIPPIALRNNFLY